MYSGSRVRKQLWSVALSQSLLLLLLLLLTTWVRHCAQLLAVAIAVVVAVNRYRCDIMLSSCETVFHINSCCHHIVFYVGTVFSTDMNCVDSATCWLMKHQHIIFPCVCWFDTTVWRSNNTEVISSCPMLRPEVRVHVEDLRVSSANITNNKLQEFCWNK